MSRPLIAVVCVLILASLCGQPAAARELPGEPPVVAQRGEPQEIKSRFAPQLKNLQIDIQTTKVELARLLAAPRPDRARVKGAVSRMLELKRQQQLLLVDQMFDTLEAMPQGNREDFLQPIIDQLLK